MSLQPLLLQPTWSRGFTCSSVWSESLAEIFKGAEQCVPEKTRFLPKAMKTLPFTFIHVLNIYKRLDLRCDNSF